MKIIKNITFLLLLYGNCLFATNIPDDDTPSDTIALDQVEITANRLLNFTAGSKVQRLSPSEIGTYYSTTLSELFAEITPVTIKSYGLSGISNVSLRGMGAKHTAVLWNGINLQSMMNGGVDMNSFPTFLIDEASIQYGGSSALFGSGAVGGIIHLNSIPEFNQGMNISYNQNIGSFDNFFEGLKVNYSNSKLSSSTRIYHAYGENDFEFVNKQQFGHPTVKQENSAQQKYGILQSNAFKIGTNQKITTNIWAQNHFQEIPSMTTSAQSKQNQNTDIARVSAMYNLNREITSWYTRVYYNFLSQVYKDPLSNLISEMETYSMLGEIENKTSLGNHLLLNTGLNYENNKVLTSNYGTEKNRQSTALYSSLKYYNTAKTFTSVFSVREEYVDKNFTPVTYSLGVNYQPVKFLIIHSNYSKNYNLPTFNDLYWLPGGNPDLNEETGWSSDLGIDMKLSSTKHEINFGAAFFNNYVENMVVWQPTTSSYWTAENVEKLWATGLETNIEYKFNLKHFTYRLKTFYNYTKSIYVNEKISLFTVLDHTLQNEYYKNEGDFYGNQLLYVPEHKGGIILSSSYKNFNLQYNHNFVGDRYITKDNKSEVDGYQVGNLTVGSKVKIKSSQLDIHLRINNIWNETYEVMAFYAMPLRYYSLSLTYNFNKQTN